jgi:hypothetical protein
MSTKKKTAVETVMEPKFTKESLMNAKRFRNERDLISALLENDVEYTIPEVEEMIANYMKGMVK